MKKQGNEIIAYQLGSEASKDIEDKLISEGKMKKISEGEYELFSQEAVNNVGEKASVGDYFKIDSTGYPYPNEKSFFEENHTAIEGNRYMQKVYPLNAWKYGDDMCKEIEFLIIHKGLKLDVENKERYFGAPLWGTYLNADINAVLVFYSIHKDVNGEIVDADFNFISKSEFDNTYEFII